MKTNIKATNIDLTPAIADYVEKKIQMLEKHLDPSLTGVLASVEVGKSSKHHKSGSVFRAEIHLAGGGLDLYADSEQEDLYGAIDTVKDEIARILEESKDKKETLSRKGARAVKNMMKGFTDRTSRGFSWGAGKFKNIRNFRNRK